MSNCGCDGQCNCILQAGNGVLIDGIGTPLDPYVITATGTISGGEPGEPAESLTIDPAGGLVIGTNGLGIKPDPASPTDLDLSAGGLSVDAPDQSALHLGLYWRRAQDVLSGGGVRNVTQTTIAWTRPFSTTGAGRSNDLHRAAGYNISVPANGTTIAGVGGAPNRTVASGAIALGPGETLYYDPPYTSTTETSSGSNFRVVGSTANYDVPPEWIMIANRSVTTAIADGNAYEVLWGDGQRSVPWLTSSAVLQAGSGSSAVNLGSGGSQVLRHRIIDGDYEARFRFLWGSDGSSAGGALKVPIPMTPAIIGDAQGQGRFFINRSPAADYPVVPNVTPGDLMMYFLAPYQLANIRLTRAQIWDGSNGNGTTAIPQYSATAGGNIDVAGTSLEGHIQFPVA